MLPVLPCRVLQVPSATHGVLQWVLSATHPWVLAVLPFHGILGAGYVPGRVVGVGTTHLAQRVLGVLGGPLRRVCGCCGAPQGGLCPPQHQPRASLGSCSCWDVKDFTWKKQNHPCFISCITLSPMAPIPSSHGDLQVPMVVVHPNSWAQHHRPMAWVVLES